VRPNSVSRRLTASRALPHSSSTSCASASVRLAFDDVSFQVGYGEVFGFLGPNGIGKTTTVRTLGTLISPTSGRATVAGIPLSPENGQAIRKRISIMPESPGLYLRLIVAENLECFAGLYELPNARERIATAPSSSACSPVFRRSRLSRSCP
jgi:ABC-type multidrug transport system ATPase subunit